MLFWGDFQTCDYLPQLLKYQDFWNIGFQIKEFCNWFAGALLFSKLCRSE
jgi:hypothetical protein